MSISIRFFGLVLFLMCSMHSLGFAMTCNLAFGKSPGSHSGEITEARIRAAMTAENSEPTSQVSIRESGSITQYAHLDSQAMVGQKILVNFFADRYQPGSNANKYSVPQLVLTQEFLDPVSKALVTSLKRESLIAHHQFQEVGGWILFTEKGSYRSENLTSHDPLHIETDPVLQGFDQALQRARQAEGAAVKILEIEFYHTHFERGEAFSFGDLEFQQKYFRKIFRNHLEIGGTFAAYAIPVQGESIFRSVIRK